MTSEIKDHKVNHDLLMGPSDEGWAASNYPTLQHILVHGDLQVLFDKYDKPADNAKHHAQKFGFLAIGLIWLSLTLAAFEQSTVPSPTFLGRFIIAAAALSVVLVGVLLIYDKQANGSMHPDVTASRRDAPTVSASSACGSPKRPEPWLGRLIRFGLAITLIVAALPLTLKALVPRHAHNLAVRAWGEHWGVYWNWERTLKAVTAICGIVGFLIGLMGVLLGPKKNEWLHKRLMTERIRQFHFQSFVYHAREIFESLQGEQPRTNKSDSSFEAQRNRWFDVFKERFKCERREREFQKTIAPRDYIDLVISDEDKLIEEKLILLHEKKLDWFKIQESPEHPLFKAYRELRIDHQISYAHDKLRDDRPWLTAPHRQATFLWKLSLGCIVLVCASHFAALLGALPLWVRVSVMSLAAAVGLVIVWRVAPAFKPGLQAGDPTERPHLLTSVALAVLLAVVIIGSLLGVPLGADLLSPVVIWFAISALAVRAVEQALQPEREVQRYRQYRSDLWAIGERFNQAKSASAKLRIMDEMERLSFDEMRNFLISNDEAMFVM